MTNRQVWFQLHWILGITAGLVLMVVGITGATLSFEKEILRALNYDLMTVQPPKDAQRLHPEALLRQIQQDYPERKINGLTFHASPTEASVVNFASETSRRGESRYVDPYTAQVRWEDEFAHDFLHMMEDLHRRLMSGETGKQIVGASTIVLIFLTLSGLYLRWPKTVSSLRIWFTFNTKKSGRSFLSALHSIAGTWVLIFFLLASLTGLYWSYDWYRAGLYKIMGVEQPVRGAPPKPQAENGKKPASEGGGRAEPREGQTERGERKTPQKADKLAQFGQAWSIVEANLNTTPYSRVFFRFPRNGSEFSFSYFDLDPAHSRARNRIVADLKTSEIIKHERYDDKKLNEQLMSSILPLHTGEYFGWVGRILMFLAALSMPLFGITGLLLYLDRRRSKKLKKQAEQQLTSAPTVSAELADWLILHASQNGHAEKLAWQTALALQTNGISVAVNPLGTFSIDDLKNKKQCLFIASTFGEGDAPDSAKAFEKVMHSNKTNLQDLRFGLLALGDRNYDHFCGFGVALNQWLEQSGAQPIAPIVQVDQMLKADMLAWFRLIEQIGGDSKVFDQNDFSAWTLVERNLLNKGSIGLPTFELKLKPATNQLMVWQAGDLVEVEITQGKRKVYREYSISSTPDEGYLSLLIRQVKKDNGELGLGSGYLTNTLQPGETAHLQIVHHPNFHLQTTKPVIFIGNGTGLSGLRAHLVDRISLGLHENWLIFGERNQANDFYYHDTLLDWLNQGQIEKLNAVFSRDREDVKYVQDILQTERQALIDWVQRGAYIAVCGSADTMAKAVDNTLQSVLGQATYEQLVTENRYIRDVY